MTDQELEKLRFPIGNFTTPENLDGFQINNLISTLQFFPAKIKLEVISLNDEQIDTPYRPGGWTIRQVVHHVADSHMNALIRFKLTLTEESPIIKPYPEQLFAELVDSKFLPIDSSLKILDGVHERLTVLLRNVTSADFAREYVHPQYGKRFRLDTAVALYAWHCEHHLAHITQLKKRMSWK